MQDYESLKQTLHQRQLNARSIQRYVESARFEEAFSHASAEAKKELDEILRSGTPATLAKWIEKVARGSGDLSALSMRDLRLLARKLRVRDYKYLTKASLLSEITVKQRAIPDAEKHANSEDRNPPNGDAESRNPIRDQGREIRCPLCGGPWNLPNGACGPPQLPSQFSTNGIPESIGNLATVTTRAVAAV